MSKRSIVLTLFFISAVLLSYKIGYYKACRVRLAIFLDSYRDHIGILNDSDFKMMVNKTEDDFEDIKKVMQYCHDYGVKQKITGNCGEMAREFSLMAQRNGFAARAVPIGGHWAAEVYSNKYDKMVFADAYFNAYYTTLDGVPFSLMELYGRFNRPGDARRYYLKKILYEEGDDRKLKYKTFDEALAAIKRYYRENGVIMVERINNDRRRRLAELYEKDTDSTMVDLTPFVFNIRFD